MELTITNIRTFRQGNSFKIKPLTIVMGENSAGKSTLLASLAIALSNDFPGNPSLFNSPPFDLGSYDTIASYRGGKAGRAESFEIQIDNSTSKTKSKISASFGEYLGGIRPVKVVIEEGDVQVEITRLTDDLHAKLHLEGKLIFSKKRDIAITVDLTIERIRQLTLDLAFESLELTRSKRRPDEKIFEKLIRFGHSLQSAKPKIIALSPIRLKPKRTFDDFDDSFRPDGNHIPPKLAALENLRKSSQSDVRGKKRANEVFQWLDEFGSEAGLFESLDVRRLGSKRSSDPFQLRVKQGGPHVNLVDVGYGVSQSIPIVAETLLGPANAVYLVQQPEVHLHPRAQAALGTFFCKAVKSLRKNFVIETHSDYLFDRVRREIANGAISHEDVQLVYIDRPDFDSVTHHISLDQYGNLLNTPDCYRKFFLEEEYAMFSRGEQNEESNN